MLKKSRISVIFLCHNNYHIDICIDEVVRQINNEDEIIIINDNSDRKTIEIIEKYRTNPNIKIINSDIKGNRSYNRNLGAKHSLNEILIFLDGDMVIGNYGIEEIRMAHMKREEVAFIGNKHAINYDEIQFDLVCGIPNYLNLLKTYEGKEILENNPLFYDYRKKDFETNKGEYYRWLKYYTGLATVEKSIFFKIGGFDETFNSWGSEDVDLGYRISKVGKIGFINNLHGFHIPHKRKVIENEKNNKKNILYMLKKYKTWEFEILYSFNGYGNFESFYKVINKMRLLKLSNNTPNIAEKEIFIDTISLEYPHGKIVYNDNLITGLGTCVNFKYQELNKVYLSDHIFIYPKIIYCKIIQEALRISKKVVIFETNDYIRIPWEIENILPPKPQKQHYEYEVKDIFSFEFYKDEKNIINIKYIDGILK